MHVSGRPTNAALLKITQGSCCPDRKPFQNTRNAAGASSPAREDPAWAEFRLHRSPEMAIAATASMPSEMVATTHFRCPGPVCLSDSTGGAWWWFAAKVRWVKDSKYVALGYSPVLSAWLPVAL